ncbi:hypothetical protein COO60DRAFT_1627449 [Scenedesmus sp. NREL 46B-D3]|nr:hypothetical protein COO60DRAFT_1627449 [Scenedesmus sp. NREL 46B-D3]
MGRQLQQREGLLLVLVLVVVILDHLMRKMMTQGMMQAQPPEHPQTQPRATTQRPTPANGPTEAAAADMAGVGRHLLSPVEEAAAVLARALPMPMTPAANDADEDDDASSSRQPSSAGAAVPQDVIQAFLQTHQQQLDAQQLASASSIDSLDGNAVAAALRSTSSSIQKQQARKPQPTAAPVIASRLPQTISTSSRSQQVAAGTKNSGNSSSSKPRKPFVRRLLRALMITGASAGLLAAGAWGGSAAYRHYMAQLDDRDQLARRVAELKKQEERLVLRCTAVEQDRAALQDLLAQANAAAAEGDAARAKLKAELRHALADRDEAVRLNLKLQGKLTELEDGHAALQGSFRESQAALELARGEAGRLGKEAGQLAALVEKLEGRCGGLELARGELQREVASLAAEARQARQHA